MGIKIEDLKDTLSLKVSSLEGTVNVYSKPNVFSLKVSPNVNIPRATQNDYGVIKGGHSVLVADGIPAINPEYLSSFMALNIGAIITGDSEGSIIPVVNDLIHQYFDSVKHKFLSSEEPDTAEEVITFLKGIVAMGTSLFANLIASGILKVDGLAKLTNTEVTNNLSVDGFTQLSNADISGEVSAETAVIRDSLLTDLLRVTTQATILDILLQGQINSETFDSGFLGHGFRLNKLNDRWTLELDDLIVRKTMTIYELIVQKIRYQGGQVLHSPAGGKVTDVIEESDGWRCEHDSTDSFITGALVLCLTFKVGSEKQNPDGSTTFQGTKVKRYWRLVTDYGKGWFKLSKTDMEAGSDIPEINDDVAVLGHRTDSTQQSAILIVSAGQNSPYIAHYSNINSYVLEGKEVVREGNLEGIVDNDFGQLEGYGLYSNNVYLKGQLRIRTGLTIEEALDEIKDKRLLRVEKFNTPGYDFYREGQEYNHTLGIRIFEDEEDVTDSINIARFVWMRISENEAGDSIWNDLHTHSGASVDITQLDLVGDTSFIVQFWDASKETLLRTTKF